MSIVVALAFTALWVVRVEAKPRLAPSESKAFGKTLTEWHDVYWRWMFGEGDGMVGNVRLMPMPSSIPTGDGSKEAPLTFVGQLDVTLEAGTAFVLPLYGYIGERYEGYPDVPDDEPFPDELLLSWLHPEFTIDGQTVVSEENKADFYVGPSSFDPIIMYPAPSEYGSVAAIWFQGIGIVCPPLSEGEHVLHLYEEFTIPDAFYMVFDNTWNITVVDEDDNND
jgi:hypothetical protein